MELKLHSKYPQNEKLSNITTLIYKNVVLYHRCRYEDNTNLIAKSWRNSLMLWKELFDVLEGTLWWFGRNFLMLWKEIFDVLEGTLWCFGRVSYSTSGTWCVTLVHNLMICNEIRIMTKLPNSEQSYKGKVKTHNYIYRQNQSTTGKLWRGRRRIFFFFYY